MSVPSYIKLSPQMNTATLVNALNQNFNQVQSQDRRKVITDEEGNDRIVLGRQENGSYAIKVSAPGYNVNTAPDDKLILNSSNNLFKIVDTGTVTLSSPNLAGSSSYINVSHTLNKNPTVLAFASFSPTGTPQPLPIIGVELVAPTPGLVNYQLAFEAVGGNTITFFWRDIARANNITAYIRYYIIQETASYTD